MTSQTSEKRNPFKSAGMYVLLPLLLASLAAWLGAATYPAVGALPPQKNSAASPPVGLANVTSLPASAITAPTPNPPPDLDTRLKELEASQKTLYSSWLDGQRKTIDWWLAFLAVMMGVLALAGVAIPYLMGRKDKELMTQLLKEADRTVADAQQQLTNIKTAAVEAGQHRESARADAAAIASLKQATSDQDQTPEKTSELALAAKSVKEDTQASQIDKLRAEAVEAAAQKETEKAYTLWAAVAALEPTDHVAQFNTGFWSKMQASKETPQGNRFWLQQAARAYAQALQIKPDMHEAANNWGNALAAEAKALADSDLPAARALWLQAGQRYAQALQIKPDKHEAAYNWGNALLRERWAVVATDPDEANIVLERALKLLQSHAQSAPNAVAYNLACGFALKGDVLETLKWLECEAKSGKLLTKSLIQTDKDFDSIRNDSQFVAWFDKLKEE